MKFLIALLFILSSFSALASYQCRLKLVDVNDVKSVLEERSIKAMDRDLTSSTMENFFKDQNLSLRVMMDGWVGEEQAAFTVMKDQKSLGEKTLLKGQDRSTLFFDSFKLDITCDLLKA